VAFNRFKKEIQSKLRLHLCLHITLLAVLGLLLLPVSVISAADKEVRIAVLAKRGVPKALKMWTPTANYLSNAIPGYTFKIQPVSIDSIDSEITTNNVNFVFTNPFLYPIWRFNHYARRSNRYKNAAGLKRKIIHGCSPSRLRRLVDGLAQIKTAWNRSRKRIFQLTVLWVSAR
jgi:hypothetical protein